MPEDIKYGVGLKRTGDVIDLQPANYDGDIGGVKTIGRGPTQGLDLDATGLLTAPLATDKTAGSIIEPPADDELYVRTRSVAGDSSWAPVPPDIADLPILLDRKVNRAGDAMSGPLHLPPQNPTFGYEATHKNYVDSRITASSVVSLDDPPIDPSENLLWFESDTGDFYIWFDDGTSQQWVQLNGVNSELFILKAGDTMTGPLLLPTIDPIDPSEATHKKYVDESIAAAALYQGVWQVAANIPDLDPAVALPLHTYSWAAITVDPTLAETAPGNLPGIGGVAINEGDSVIWNANTSMYELIRAVGAMAGYVNKGGDTMTGGILWGPGTVPLDTTKHLTLNKDAGYHMGFSASTNGALNYVVENNGNVHRFHVGGIEKFQVNSNGTHFTDSTASGLVQWTNGFTGNVTTRKHIWNGEWWVFLHGSFNKQGGYFGTVSVQIGTLQTGFRPGTERLVAGVSRNPTNGFGFCAIHLKPDGGIWIKIKEDATDGWVDGNVFHL